MTTLDNGHLLELAGGAVTPENAADVEPVTDEDVRNAAKLASEAEELAAESERRAVLGEVDHAQAVNDRESARFARLRHALTERRHERYKAAQRLQALAAVGEDALALAGRLKGLRDATLADLAEVEQLLARVRERIHGWNQELGEIAARGAELNPEDIPPSGAPLPSSAFVWATTTGHGPRIVVKRRVIRYIDSADPDLIHAIGAATAETSGATSADRLVLLPSGVVTTVGADPHGHFAKQIREGSIHELTLPERERYLRGEVLDWETIQRD